MQQNAELNAAKHKTLAIKYAKHLYIQANNGVFSAKTTQTTEIQIITNFRNTPKFPPRTRKFLTQGTHNVKI